MYDKSTSDKKFGKKNLILEKRKTMSQCINLEFKKEQLETLIERLHQLSTDRENLNTAGQLYMKNSNLFYELKIARENSLALEREISEVKGKIVKIDEALSE